MKGFGRLRSRERRLALATAVIIGSWALISWGVQPLWNRLRDLREHIQSQAERLAAFHRLLRQAPTVEQRYQAVSSYLEKQGEEQAQDAFLNELETLSRSANLQLNLKPRSLKHSDHLDRFEVELDVEGSQEYLMGFLDSLFQLPRLMTIDRLRISTVPSRENVLRANLVIQRIIPQH